MSETGSLARVAGPAPDDRIQEPVRSGKAFLAAIGLMAAVTFMYWPTLASLAFHWEDTASLTYTHGYLVAGIVLWLVLRQRHAVAELSVVPSAWAAAAVAVLSLVWLIAFRAGIEVGHQLLLPVILWLGLLAALGWQVARHFAFPAAYLLFAIPVWSLGNGILQSVSVHAVRVMLRIFGVPAYFENNFVHVPSGVFEIAGGCSGLHFFIVGIALAALQGELQRDSWRNRMVLLLLVAGLTMAGNWVRIFVIIIAGHLTDMQHFLIQVDHYYFGWVVFAFVMAAFLFLANKLPVSPETQSRTVEPPRRMGVAKASVVMTAAVIGLSAGPAWAMIHPVRPSAGVPGEFPQGVSSWVGPRQDVTWQPVFPGADSEQSARYQKGNVVVEVYLATYRWQAQGKELVGYDSSLIGSDDWHLVSTGKASSMMLPLQESLVADEADNRAILWHTYFVGSIPYLRGIDVQLAYGVRSLIGAPQSGVLAFKVNCAHACEDERVALNDLLIATGGMSDLAAVSVTSERGRQ